MQEGFERGWTQVLGEGPFVAVASHNGHELRAEVRDLAKLPDQDRLREEDPFTGEWTSIAPTRFVAMRSRFEVDLNRARHEAVYLGPDDAWGLDIWKEPLSQGIVDRSLAEYDAYYAALREVLVGLEREYGAFVVFDLHSYNHRRDGSDGPEADPEKNPEVNVGTGRMNRAYWAPVVDAFIDTLSNYDFQGRRLDVRENVKFVGRQLPQWVHENFPETGCVLAIEVKKFFMDEWNGEANREAVDNIQRALASTVEPVLAALKSTKKAKRETKRDVSTPHRAMRIGFVVNDVMTEEAGYTTTRLGMRARQMGHDIWVMGLGDLAYDADEKIRAHGRSVPKRIYKNGASFLKDLQGKAAIEKRVTVDDLDILMLRNDPSIDAVARPWATNIGIQFGRVAMRHGVVVLNDPDGLARATSKMYFQTFPAEVRPLTIISRDRADIKAFAKEYGTIVLKPLQGSGGQSVFLVRPEDVPNLNQMIDSVSRDGFVIAQAYLPAAAAGDTRLFVMNGEALRHRGKYAAFRRIRQGGDMRSNIHAGGSLARAEIGPEALELVEMVRPKLMRDGMFLVGLDIVGNKLMEINVFSPGGLGSAQKFEGVNFAEAVMRALERKTRAMDYYRRQFDNVGMAII
ncbi:MAG: glutathione synthetase [Polyangiales bacterium]